MDSLYSLRETLLTRLGFESENISAFVTKGTMRNHYHRLLPEPDNSNDGLALEYTAEVIIIDCTTPPQVVAHVAGQWLHEHCPSHSPTAITFEAEILDNDAVDLHIKISGLSDRYLVAHEKDGDRVTYQAPQCADAVQRHAGIVKVTSGRVPNGK